jgi:hypothetical protein
MNTSSIKTTELQEHSAFIKTTALHEYLENVAMKPTLSSIVRTTCQLYTNSDGMFFYRKTDIRQCFVKHLFYELETHVITYQIENWYDILPYTAKPTNIK